MTVIPSGFWDVDDGGQFITYGGNPVAMADTPNRAREITAALNAQEAGWSTAQTHYEQCLADVRAEFQRRLEAADRRATRAEENSSQTAEVDLMCDALRLIDQHGCTNNTIGRCWDDGRTRGARYGADAWCDACVAADALKGSVEREKRLGTTKGITWRHTRN